MSKSSVTWGNLTMAGANDAANLSDAGYIALVGPNATQVTFFSEIYMGGLAITQCPMDIILASDSQVATGTLGGTLTNTGIGAAYTGLSAAPTAFNTATVLKPQRGTQTRPWRPAFNAFGGIARMTALDPSHRPRMIGNAAASSTAGGEWTLSCTTQSTPGAMSGHWIYEVE